MGSLLVVAGSPALLGFMRPAFRGSGPEYNAPPAGPIGRPPRPGRAPARAGRRAGGLLFVDQGLSTTPRQQGQLGGPRGRAGRRTGLGGGAGERPFNPGEN